MEAAGPATPWLEALAPPDAAAFRNLGAERRYRPGVVIFHHGDDPGVVLTILDGQGKGGLPGPPVKGVILGFVGPGELLGDGAALDGGPRSASAEAVGEVRALVMPRAAFEGFVAGHPGVAIALMRSLAHRLRLADAQRL